MVRNLFSPIIESLPFEINGMFFQRCKEEDSTLVTRYKPRKSDQDDVKYKKYKEKVRTIRYENDAPWDPSVVKKSSKRCGECSGCTRMENCGKCDACRHLKKFGPSVRLKLRCVQRTCRVLGAPPKPLKGYNKPSKPSKKRKRDSSNERAEHPEQPKQCYGPACTKQSRLGSKYCSDECGMKLATNRIYQVLPQRIQEWSLTSCVAERNNRRALETVRKQQNDVRRILQELDKRHLELDRILERAKQASIDTKTEIDDIDDTEMSMYCITCGHEIHSRTAIKHMEKCFNKVSHRA